MFNKLFEPLKIGKLEIKNRLIVPPMHSGSATTEHLFSQQSINYFAERAKGGFGLIITEFLCVSEEGLADETQVGIYNDSFIDNLSEVASAIHENGGKCFAQLHHAGIQCDVNTTNQIAVGASRVPAINKLQPVHELTTKEVWDLVEKFGDAAVRAQKSGFDGVEVHGAHGYLIGQFLSKATNKRIDEFGGSVTARAKFASEIIKNIKKKCGSDYPISFRISARDDIEGGNTIIDTAAQVRIMETSGADAIHVSIGVISSRTIIVPNTFQPGFNTENSRIVKENVSIPVICVGRINDPAIAESIIASGAADFVSLGRQSISDPHFPNKVKENKLEEIFYCTGCMQRCIGGKPCEESDTGVSCMINPFSGKEGIWKIEPTEKVKNVVVIGAGPSGLQAAWILAKRGHKVTVLEKQEMAGGQYRLASIPPMKQDLARTINTYVSLCIKYGVEIKYGIEVTEDILANHEADTIILATGSTPIVPPIKGIDGENVYKANDILNGDKIIANKKLLVIGAGLVGCETAEYLSLYNNKVTIVDMIKEMAPLLGNTPRKYLLQNLEKAKVNFKAETKVLEFKQDGILYESNNKQGELSGFDGFVLAIGSRSYNPLLEIAEKMCSEVYSVGDAKKASDAKMGIYEASKIAMSI